MIDQTIAPNTITPIATQIQKIHMCSVNTSWLISVTPVGRL
jgi:hypothetical protein